MRSLLDIPFADLTFISGARGLDSEIQLVHVSEVPDPTPWLNGGEFLLTTGAQLPSPDAMRAYISRLHAHGLAGIGLGTGPDMPYHAVPITVQELSDELEFPIIEVPFDVPFIGITEFVSTRHADERYRVVQLAYKAQQQLIQTALSDDAIGGLVTRLAELTSGWAVVTNTKGDPVGIAPARAVELLPGLQEDLQRVRETGSVVSVDEGTGRTTLIHPLGGPGVQRGMLILGRMTTPDVFVRMIAASAASLLSFILEQRMTLSPQRMAADNLLGETLLASDPPSAQFARAAAGLGIGAQDLLIVARFMTPQGSPPVVAQTFHDIFTQRGNMGVTVLDANDSQLHTLITDSSEVSVQEFELIGQRFSASGVWAGVSVPARLSSVHLAYNQASLALSHARRNVHPSLVRFEDLSYYDQIIGLASEAEMNNFMATILSPLERLEERKDSGTLIETLSVFLAHHGRWEPAARELGVHRQTLMKRVARIQKHLAIDLGSPDARMGLWFALQARDAQKR